ncbi:MAG: RsmD family RNA methyltransferase [Deltaproteobacteria bacterium]|nr:RsmD family RNA methyltransferase [Deltaproteobacteria bacterium]
MTLSTIARPTAALAREAIFSTLADRVPGARALDLFADSGALGLEAFSRGAERVVLWNGVSPPLRRLKPTLPSSSPAVSRFGAVPRALTGVHGQFDLILMDPPTEPLRRPLGARRPARLAPRPQDAGFFPRTRLSAGRDPRNS